MSWQSKKTEALYTVKEISGNLLTARSARGRVWIGAEMQPVTNPHSRNFYHSSERPVHEGFI
jgi:hypothetical protein